MNIIQIYEKFKTEKHCIKYLESVRWKDQVKCPYCQGVKITGVKKELRHHCNTCNKSFCVTVGTIFHNTKCDLRKWFFAISSVMNAKKGISALQLSREIKVNKNTAWFMLMRIRKAFTEKNDMIVGVYELDEVFCGGKTTNKHKWQRKILNEIDPKGHDTKNIVFGMLLRGGKVSCVSVPNRNPEVLMPIIKNNIPTGSTIVTDGHIGYNSIKKTYKHVSVNHEIDQFNNGEFHTNTIEGFWAILKRGIYGQFHKISKNYLNKYLAEFCFRYNNRKAKDVFSLVLENAVNL